MHTVLWSDEALEALAQLWAHADPLLQVAITAAVHRIDKRLGDDPENAAESRDGLKRVWLDFPLGVLFKIDPAKKAVHLGKVWTFRKRR
jgi:hypothetical protein